MPVVDWQYFRGSLFQFYNLSRKARVNGIGIVISLKYFSVHDFNKSEATFPVHTPAESLLCHSHLVPSLQNVLLRALLFLPTYIPCLVQNRLIRGTMPELLVFGIIVNINISPEVSISVIIPAGAVHSLFN